MFVKDVIAQTIADEINKNPDEKFIAERAGGVNDHWALVCTKHADNTAHAYAAINDEVIVWNPISDHLGYVWKNIESYDPTDPKFDPSLIAKRILEDYQVSGGGSWTAWRSFSTSI